jgi:hypothetical protein
VVSVPTDCSAQKMRVCRYTVIDTIDAPYTAPVKYTDTYDGSYDDEYDYDSHEDYWGDGEAGDEADYYAQADDYSDAYSAYADDLEKLADYRRRDRSEVLVTGFDGVNVGDKFQSTDRRRFGTTFEVTGFDGDYAVGKSYPLGLTRKIKLDRLNGIRYRKV